MGATTATKKTTKATKVTTKTTLKPRKATFTLVKGKGETVYVAVNKRAHTVCKKAGKRTKLTEGQLKAQVGKGSYTFHVYNDKGELKPIKFKG